MTKLFLCFFSLIIVSTSFSAQAGRVGDTPSFISIEKCPALAKKLIDKLGIHINKIHACEISEENVFQSQKTMQVIQLSYDDPEDCMAGCIYKKYTAVTDGARFWEVPPRGYVASLFFSTLPEYNKKFNKKDFSCDGEPDRILSETVGAQDGQWGRYLELTTPFACHWIEGSSTIYPVDYTHSFNKGFKFRGEWSGSVFFKTDNGKKLVPVPNLRYSEKKLQEISWEERH